MCAPYLGHCIDGKIDDTYAGQTIKLQEKLLKHQQYFLSLNKNVSNSCLLRDKRFMELLFNLISPNHYMRPSIQEIAESKFIIKNTTSIVDRMKNVKIK